MYDYKRLLDVRTGKYAAPKDFPYIDEIEKKMADAFMRLYTKPANKQTGNPFVATLAMPKNHYLATHLGRHKCKICGEQERLWTAATDGKNYFWNPDFLRQCTVDNLITLIVHETYHTCFSHCHGGRGEGKHPIIWNYAVDYVVNSVHNADCEKYGVKANWSASPLSIKELKASMKKEGVYAGMMKSVNGKCNCDEPLGYDPQKARICHDPAAFGLSPEEIYEKLMEDNPNGETNYQIVGDMHLPSEATVEEIMADMLGAYETAKMMGDVPDALSEALGKLLQPELKLIDIVRNIMYRNKVRNGLNNDWKKLKRRPMHILNPKTLQPEHRLYMPNKKRYVPNWVAMLDTSGSMSDLDIVNGVKELKLIANLGGVGHVVPCDAAPHWEGAVKITKDSDIVRTKVIGRGGTVFEEFFRELPKQHFGQTDLVIIITDGDCPNVSMSLKPKADVLWVITNKREFKPTFGRVAQLDESRQ